MFIDIYWLVFFTVSDCDHSSSGKILFVCLLPEGFAKDPHVPVLPNTNVGRRLSEEMVIHDLQSSPGIMEKRWPRQIERAIHNAMFIAQHIDNKDDFESVSTKFYKIFHSSLAKKWSKLRFTFNNFFLIFEKIYIDSWNEIGSIDGLCYVRQHQHKSKS